MTERERLIRYGCCTPEQADQLIAMGQANQPLPNADELKAKVKDRVEADLMDAWRTELKNDIRGDHVRNMLAAITEFSISLRNASKAGRLMGNARERWNLADEIDLAAKRLATVADEVRRDAK